MLKIGNVRLGEVPRVVLGIVGNQSSLSLASKSGVDIFEARIDQFDQLDPAFVVNEIRAIRKFDLPIIGTVRSKKEGGRVTLSDSRRIIFYEKISSLVDAVDIELYSSELLRKQVRAIAAKNKNALILSYHNFGKTPSERELESIVRNAKSEGADIVKIAAFGESDSDIIRLFEFTAKNRSSSLVTISMGARGAISRLSFPLAGSLMTYTSVEPSDGQVPLLELVDHLRMYYPRYNEEIISRLELMEYI
ncbi:MAG: type I 3-dehydroquinate dehydratase [Candidatus Omnitrophica bacterium]|nr:type I 3-dehydroquinate dehydratase [Candidatus Omnitrophota bacterium]